MVVSSSDSFDIRCVKRVFLILSDLIIRRLFLFYFKIFISYFLKQNGNDVLKIFTVVEKNNCPVLTSQLLAPNDKKTTFKSCI